MKGDLAEMENSFAGDEASSQPSLKPALCNVGKPATRKLVLDRTTSFVLPVNTHLTMLPSQGGQLRTDKSDVYEDDFVADEEVQDAPGELRRQPVVGVGGTQEEQGREWLAL